MLTVFKMAKIVMPKTLCHPELEIPVYYENFEWYRLNCEGQTKEMVCGNAQPDWVYLDCGAHIGCHVLFP